MILETNFSNVNKALSFSNVHMKLYFFTFQVCKLNRECHFLWRNTKNLKKWKPIPIGFVCFIEDQHKMEYVMKLYWMRIYLEYITHYIGFFHISFPTYFSLWIKIIWYFRVWTSRSITICIVCFLHSRDTFEIFWVPISQCTHYEHRYHVVFYHIIPKLYFIIFLNS